MPHKTNYRDGDSYTRKSKKEGYRSRASFKLKEILEKDIKVHKRASVIDLGSFPGSWSQVITEHIGSKGKITAVDMQPMKEIKDCFFIQKKIEDIQDVDFEKIKDFLPFDLVLSDMAPNISGIKERDNALMIDLVDNVLLIVDKFLKKEGTVLIKVFQGESLDYTKFALNERFEKIKIFKPKASRPNSNEIYIIGKEFKII
jgi:23S rRNA (uridine2552-2'-O)-methyltransferase